jgi:hypothetical protein
MACGRAARRGGTCRSFLTWLARLPLQYLDLKEISEYPDNGLLRRKIGRENTQDVNRQSLPRKFSA